MKHSSTELRLALEKLGAVTDDYRIAARVGAGYLARTRAGGVAWIVELESSADATGRRAGGFVLAPVASLEFEFESKKWLAPAAVWESTDPQLLGAFLVLVGDAAVRLGPSVTWKALVAYVDEWQALLARRPVLSPEQQIGLWAELEVIRSAKDPDKLVAAWIGPDRAPVDFLLDGIGLEVKASRRRHCHHVSQSQGGAPVGVRDAYTVSFWLSQDPAAGQSLIDLLDDLLERIVDKPEFYKKLASVGFSLADQDSYRANRYLLLDQPLVFPSVSVPRIPEMDPAISEVRYVVTLDSELALSEVDAAKVSKKLGISLQLEKGRVRES